MLYKYISTFFLKYRLTAVRHDGDASPLLQKSRKIKLPIINHHQEHTIPFHTNGPGAVCIGLVGERAHLPRTVGVGPRPV